MGTVPLTFWRQPCSKEQRRIAQYQQHLPRSRCNPDVKSAKTTPSLRLPDSTVIFSDAIDILPSYLTATSFNRRTASSTPISAGWALTWHMASTSFESLEYNLQAEHWGLSWFVMVCPYLHLYKALLILLTSQLEDARWRLGWPEQLRSMPWGEANRHDTSQPSQLSDLKLRFCKSKKTTQKQRLSNEFWWS